jgi:hypothetical protein
MTRGKKMPPQLGDVIKPARQARRLTLCRPAGQVTNADGSPISPRYLADIEVHHRGPAPYVLRELARVLELDYDRLLACAGAAAVAAPEYLPSHTADRGGGPAVSCGAGAGFEEWAWLKTMITRGKVDKGYIGGSRDVHRQSGTTGSKNSRDPESQPAAERGVLKTAHRPEGGHRRVIDNPR